MIRRFYQKRRLRTRESSLESIQMSPTNYAEFHVVSGDDPASASINSDFCPSSRSGHRVFVTHDFLYCIGGFDTVNGGTIFREVWRMNLLTKQWAKMELENDEKFPDALASFAICQTAPFSDQIFLFGGTGIPFGVKSSNNAYMLTMLPNGKVRSEKLDVLNNPRPVYGHAMVRATNPSGGKYYTIGGTTGHNFYLDIHTTSLDKTRDNPEWRWESTAEWTGTGEQNEPPGLYRLECIIDQDKLIMFGGGTPDYVQGFEKMYYFDLVTNKYATFLTHGDPNAEAPYPIPRRCHSITQWGRKVIMAGGCGVDVTTDAGRTNQLYKDVWIFDLDHHNWVKHTSMLSIAVFFHSAAITADGCLFVHGGVSDEQSTNRSNTLQAIWISPPNLLYWSSKKVLTEIKKNAMTNPKKARSEKQDFNLEDFVISRCDVIYAKIVGSPA